MSNGTAIIESPDHVAQAAMDEDIRQAAIDGSRRVIQWGCELSLDGMYNTLILWPSETPANRASVDRALRILRHFGLLVEHGDGVVSVKEKA